MIVANNPPQEGTLDRRLGLRPLVLLIAANMIGTGIFTTSGFILGDVGQPWLLLLCWLVGGLIALAGGLCYAELGAMYPEAGGEYVFLREVYGKRVAFLSGWVSLWVGFSAPVAAAAHAFSAYSLAAMPDSWHWHGAETVLGLLVIAVFTCVHWRGLKFGVSLQSVLTGGKLVVIGCLLILGFSVGAGDWGHFGEFSWSAIKVDSKFATSLIFVSFAYSGWNASAYLGSEVRNPQRNIPVSIITATLLVAFVYMGLNAVYVYACEPGEMAGVEEVGGLAASNLFGGGWGHVFSALIAFFLLSTISAMVLTGPRVYYAMAKDGLLPKCFSRVESGQHAPGFSILLQGVIAAVLLISATFTELLIYIGFLLSAFASLTVAGVIVLRFRRPGATRAYRTLGYPLTPLIFVVMNVWIIAWCFGGNRTVFFWGGITLLGGLVFYEIFRYREKHNNPAA